MEAIRVGVYMEDIYHAEAISTALNYLGGFEAHGLNKDDSTDECDILAVQDATGTECFGYDKPHVRIVFEKDKEDLNSLPISIYMSQSVKVLAEALSYSLGRKSIYSASSRDSEKVRVIVAASDRGGSGVTTMSVALGRCLYRLFEERALYLSLSPYNGTALNLLSLSEKNDESKGSFVRLIYGIQHEKEHLIQASIAECKDIDAVKMPSVNIDCGVISEDEIAYLAAKAYELGYAYLLIDIGNQFDYNKKRIIENAFCLVSVNSDRKMTIGSRRTISVSNAISKYKEGSSDADILIPFAEEISSRSLDGDFGRAVNKIAFLMGGEDDR